jgi:FlaG/FlaF family flagellin (archaellin)
MDAALETFGSGEVTGRVAPRALPEVSEAAMTAADEAPALAEAAGGRLPSAPSTLATADPGLGALDDADLHATTVAPDIKGVDALAVGVDFAARGPVVRARVTGTDGAPARDAALDALSAAGLPMAALDPFAIPDGDALALDAGLPDRDDGQPVVLALLLVVLAAVVGTFVLGLGNQVSSTAPQISFEFDYDADSQLVTVTHDGGDSVPAEELQLAYESGGEIAVDTWVDEQDGTVTAGDSFTTGSTVDSGSAVRVVWQNTDGDGAAELGEFQVP